MFINFLYKYYSMFDAEIHLQKVIAVVGTLIFHMILGGNYKKVRIEITTFVTDNHLIAEKIKKNMNDSTKKSYKTQSAKFICSICLNTKKPEETKSVDMNEKAKSKCCPICQKCCHTCKDLQSTNETRQAKTETFHLPKNIGEHKSKIVQTSQTDVTQNWELLKEVLSAFQTKKSESKGVATNTLKETGVQIDCNRKSNNLTINKVYEFSIEGNNITNEHGKFTVVKNCNSKPLKKSDCSFDLIKHKSSSIPQMKLDEIKNAVKEKSKSKNAIQEINRMFATVKRSDGDDFFETSNRPMIRNGPRVLPVVKTQEIPPKKALPSDKSVSDCRRQSCCCQVNYCMSGGDSSLCCHHKNTETERTTDKCVYMVCCHYRNHRELEAGLLICEKCKNESNLYQ